MQREEYEARAFLERRPLRGFVCVRVFVIQTSSRFEAHRGAERWVIEAKRGGSRQPMRVDYFIGRLSETLQRMDDPVARYNIALLDLVQYRGLWQRLPLLVKDRTQITLLLASSNGKITQQN